jgi:prepilin-type N-terminal cleavage/methylation domain-containing protein
MTQSILTSQANTSGPDRRAESGGSCARRSRRRAYTLIEMLTTIAILVIALGLMVSLARRVRAQSARALTESVLLKLDGLMAQYVSRHHQLPVVAPFVPEVKEDKGDKLATVAVAAAAKIEEPMLQRSALRNNRELVHVLRGQSNLGGSAFSDLPISLFDEVTLRDAWGTPIVFMPKFHPDVGMAPNDRYFFVSAGPDGHFLTRDDNLYSYEGPAERP